jgi:uncharacterized membrane protein
LRGVAFLTQSFCGIVNRYGIISTEPATGNSNHAPEMRRRRNRMIPLIVLALSFAGFLLMGIWFPYLSNWQISLRAALGVMFLLTASAHWGRRRPDMIRMVPQSFGEGGKWVTLTGVAELFIAVGLQVPIVATPAAVFAAVMLVCIFPANVKAAREKVTIAGRAVPELGARLLIQLLFLGALAAAIWRL